MNQLPRLFAPVLLVVLLVLSAAACGGDDDGGAQTGPTETVAQPPAEPEAGEVMEEFVRAASAGNAQAMFDLLSSRAKIRFGPTAQDFARGSGKELSIVLGSFDRRGEWEVVLAARASEEFAVSTVEGYVEADGRREYGAYSTPLREENGEWKIELGGTVTFNPLTPEPELESRSRPEISAEVNASEPVLDLQTWVDDTAIPAELSPDELIITATSPELDDGRHTITVFAQSQSSAGSNAWTFVVG